MHEILQRYFYKRTTIIGLPNSQRRTMTGLGTGTEVSQTTHTQ